MGIKYSVIKEDEFIKSVWSGGTTEQIYIYPPDAIYKNADFLFRISRASVDISPSEFTKIPGVYRFIMPLDSELILTHDNKTDINLKPFESYEFSAEIHTKSRSVAKDFNLMLANGAEGDMKSVYLEADHPFIYKHDKYIHDIVHFKNESMENYDNKLIKVDENEFQISSEEYGSNQYTQTKRKYFTGFYTPIEGMIINIDGQSINLPACSLFLAESDYDAKLRQISINSKTCSYIIVIRVYI